MPDQPDLFVPSLPMPPGFAYGEAIIGAAEEAAAVAEFQRLPFEPFQFHQYTGNRRIVSFGWRYDYAGRALRPSDPIPAFLLPLREKAAGFAGVPPEELRQILVTEYAPGAGIGWHRDKPMFRDVIALSFLSPCTLRLRRRDGEGWQRFSRAIAPCSAYMLRGAARREWEHSVPVLKTLRYSLTFRNFEAGRNFEPDGERTAAHQPSRKSAM
ncbi:MAG TPA: alpha-ketoglutarate-dependent dioxygenase AlkB [Dongiaceae bacterium]|jgi:alkylated DNA repair dioxygenase AlkB